ncbi:lysozyme inhibitor LprI family protein [Burkholderia gladioli]|uniref:lysozyme inhibitor LprI family protein n=1 Tax=Burkholderia gladioli TaxID=28095 RepID=UPI00163FC044|nr:lysozyme inhibitor LprI family protein [Burkholderia gladioli]
MTELMRQKAFPHLVFVGLSLCLSVGTYAAGPSFNCTKAKSAAEKAICVHPGLAALDVKIAQEYRALRAKLDPPAAAALTDDQRWFIGTRDAIAEASRNMSPPDLGAFLNDRVRFLSAIDPHPPEGFVGSWRNVAGGFDIEIKADGTLSITGNAAQPANGNWVCEYQGTGKAASSNMLEPTTGEMDANASRLRLSREGASLKVKTVVANGSDSNTFCGMNGSFDGTYFAVPRSYNSSTSHSS